MKTTIDIQDELLVRAKQLAKRTGLPLRAVVEECLRQTLSQAERQSTYELPDNSLGDANAEDLLESLIWQDLRDEIYGGLIHDDCVGNAAKDRISTNYGVDQCTQSSPADRNTRFFCHPNAYY